MKNGLGDAAGGHIALKLDFLGVITAIQAIQDQAKYLQIMNLCSVLNLGSSENFRFMVLAFRAQSQNDCLEHN